MPTIASGPTYLSPLFWLKRFLLALVGSGLTLFAIELLKGMNWRRPLGSPFFGALYSPHCSRLLAMPATGAIRPA